jgi:carboxypeptidase D
MYCPYLADAMLNANDTSYFNVSGMLIYDPSIAYVDLQNPVTTVPFVDYWYGLMPFNDSFSESLHSRFKSCGYEDYINKYLVYPPAGQQPTLLPGQYDNGTTIPECNNVYYDIWDAASELNPCWDVYQVATTCPILWDVLGFPGTIGYISPGQTDVYFDRADVKKAIHAPLDVTWAECASGNVFVAPGDLSLPPSVTVLPGVIDRTKNVIIGHGSLDMILIANGTLLAIQNMTWGGKMGFQSKPVEPFYVPYHVDPSEASWAGAGVFGTAHSERGLTYVGVDLSGHMVPQYAPSASWRHLEFLLGRIDNLNDKGTFTTQPGVVQPAGPLGAGTAPQGYSTAGSGSARRAAPPAPRRRVGMN